jgi:hypothetical protein
VNLSPIAPRFDLGVTGERIAKQTTKEKEKIMKSTMEEVFGPVISSYSRAQAIEDGFLVDMSEALVPCPFKYPVAMSRAAYEETIANGGAWLSSEGGGNYQYLQLPAGQDIKGRAHDVFWMLTDAINHPRHRSWVCACGFYDTVSSVYDAKICPKCSEQMTAEPCQRVEFAVLVDIHGNGRKTKVQLYSVCGPGDTAEAVITIMLQGED